MWAIVLEQTEAESLQYKLRIKSSKYACTSEVDGLSKAVNNELERRGYYVPQFLDIYKQSPFDVSKVNEKSYDDRYNFLTGADLLSNRDKIDELGREGTYYVLVSPLERKQQQPMDIVARDSQGT